MKILYSPIFGSLPAVTLTFDLLIPKSNQHVYEPNTCVTKIRYNSLHLFVRYGVHRVFGMHRLTDSDSLTDGHTQKQYASGTEGLSVVKG